MILMDLLWMIWGSTLIAAGTNWKVGLGVFLVALACVRKR